MFCFQARLKDPPGLSIEMTSGRESENSKNLKINGKGTKNQLNSSVGSLFVRKHCTAHVTSLEMFGVCVKKIKIPENKMMQTEFVLFYVNYVVPIDCAISTTCNCSSHRRSNAAACFLYLGLLMIVFKR